MIKTFNKLNPFSKDSIYPFFYLEIYKSDIDYEQNPPILPIFVNLILSFIFMLIMTHETYGTLYTGSTMEFTSDGNLMPILQTISHYLHFGFWALAGPAFAAFILSDN